VVGAAPILPESASCMTSTGLALKRAIGRRIEVITSTALAARQHLSQAKIPIASLLIRYMRYNLHGYWQFFTFLVLYKRVGVAL